MSTISEDIWRAKLAAWLHDPGEKALVLFRRFREGGHEGGNVKRIGELLFRESAAKVFTKEADHWASAADRPQMDFKDAGRAEVRFWKDGRLIHPLCGVQADLGELALGKDDLQRIENEVFAEALKLIETVLDGKREPDTPEEWRKVMLAFWRFLPDVARAPEGIGHLWRLLPADSRIPDHSIWTHLDITSALAGAFAADPQGEVALLMVALGPVQDFIAQARSTSDLWAGSHLLSHLTLAAMKPVIEELGPDAVIFPHLRGAPQVDVWLMQDMGLPAQLFDDYKVEWRRQKTDYNPLFMAALPNLFLAIVPRSRAEELAKKAEEAARNAMAEVAGEALGKLLDAAGDKAEGDPTVATEQLNAQIAGFPEAYWAVAPWAKRGDSHQTARERLLDILQHFADSDLPGIFSHEGFQALAQAFGEDVFRFRPNPGALYPAAHEAVGKAMGATKTLRPFDQQRQEGFRCSLCGEREWLTLDRKQLHFTRNQCENNARKGQHTLWTAIDKPSWAKRGEHLCAICTSKRLWPTLFMEQVGELLPEDARAQRFVVSTHALALAGNLMDIVEDKEKQQRFHEAWLKHEEALGKDARPVALPKRLATALHRIPDIARNLKKVPEIIENLRGTDEEERLETFLREAGLAEREKYYAVLLMDGDRMGAWISGENAITYAETFHPDIRAEAERLAQTDKTIRAYLDAPRSSSPARHVSISAALNGFALDLARVVVEELCNGKLIYAGGDDVLAMLPVEDAMKAALALRLLYGGHEPAGIDDAWLPDDFRQVFEASNGYVLHKRSNQLYMTMGPTATASAGLVIAHAMTPLSHVLAEARKAEKQAKNSGRNALAITVMKRSGNVATAVGHWLAFEVQDGQVQEKTSIGKTFPGLLAELSARLRAGELSRRAPYHMFQRLQLLPLRKLSGLAKDSWDNWDKMLTSTLAYQFERQRTPGKGDKATLRALAQRIAKWANGNDDPLHALREFLGVAEFLGRRERETATQPSERQPEGEGVA